MKNIVKKYKRYINDKGKKEGTKIKNLLSLNERYSKFNEQDIERRNYKYFYYMLINNDIFY